MSLKGPARQRKRELSQDPEKFAFTTVWQTTEVKIPGKKSAGLTAGQYVCTHKKSQRYILTFAEANIKTTYLITGSQKICVAAISLFISEW